MGHNLTIKDTDVKVLGRTVSITTDKTVAAAEQLVDESFSYGGETLQDQSQYTINRLLKNKIIALGNGVPADINLATTEDNGYGIVRLAQSLKTPFRNPYDVVTVDLVNPIHEDVENNKERLDRLEECCEEVQKWLEKKNPDVSNGIDYTTLKSVEFSEDGMVVTIVLQALLGYYINFEDIHYGIMDSQVGVIRSSRTDEDPQQLTITWDITGNMEFPNGFDGSIESTIFVYGDCSNIVSGHTVTVMGPHVQTKTVYVDGNSTTVTVYPMYGYAFDAQGVAYDTDWQFIEDIDTTEFCTVDPDTTTVAFTAMGLNSSSINSFNGTSLTIEVGNITQDTIIVLFSNTTTEYLVNAIGRIDLNITTTVTNIQMPDRTQMGNPVTYYDYPVGSRVSFKAKFVDESLFNGISVYIAPALDENDIEHNKELTKPVTNDNGVQYYFWADFDKNSSNYSAENGWSFNVGLLYDNFWVEILPIRKTFRNIYWSGSNYLYSNKATQVEDGSKYYTKISAKTDCEIVSYTVKMGGQTIKDIQGLHSQNVEFTIQSITDDLFITVISKPISDPPPVDPPVQPEIYEVDKYFQQSQVTFDGGDTVTEDTKYQATIKPKSGCAIDSVIVKYRGTNTVIPSTYSNNVLITDDVITGDIEVHVESHYNSLTVTRIVNPTGKGTFSGSNTVIYNSKYTCGFQITDTQYRLKSIDVYATSNGSTKIQSTYTAVDDYNYTITTVGNVAIPITINVVLEKVPEVAESLNVIFTNTLTHSNTNILNDWTSIYTSSGRNSRVCMSNPLGTREGGIDIRYQGNKGWKVTNVVFKTTLDSFGDAGANVINNNINWKTVTNDYQGIVFSMNQGSRATIITLQVPENNTIYNNVYYIDFEINVGTSGINSQKKTLIILQYPNEINKKLSYNNIWASPYTEGFDLDTGHMYGQEDSYTYPIFYNHSCTQYMFDYIWGIRFESGDLSTEDDQGNVLPTGYVNTAKTISFGDGNTGVELKLIDGTTWVLCGMNTDNTHLYVERGTTNVTMIRGNAGDIITVYCMTNDGDIDLTNSYLGLPQRIKTCKFAATTNANPIGYGELDLTKITDTNDKPTYGTTEIRIVDGNLNTTSGKNGQCGLYSINSLEINGNTNFDVINQNGGANGRKITENAYDYTATATINYNGLAADLSNKTVRVYYGTTVSHEWYEEYLDVRNNSHVAEKYTVNGLECSYNRFKMYPNLLLLASNNGDDNYWNPSMNITISDNQISFPLCGNIVSNDKDSTTMSYVIYIIDKTRDYDPTNDN